VFLAEGNFLYTYSFSKNS